LGIDTELVHYQDGPVDLSGVFAWDNARAEKRPGILVVHGGAGLDEHAKKQARRLAGLGYVAFACDMYGEGVIGDRQRVMARITELCAEPSRLSRRAAAGLEVLRSHPMVDGRLAAVGYCFGGMTALELARSGAELMAVVSVHGTLKTTQRCRPGAVKARILVCHGALDPHVPMAQVNDFISEMTDAATDWQLIVYGGALHGFTHEGDSPMPGVAYNASADARSRIAIRNFLSEAYEAQS
jgi:dienelactone hydrolase